MAWAGIAYWLMLKGQVAYTLTATHFQQHFYQGGWVVKWNNISQIGVCSYEREGWHQPLPWVGIRLKHYAPYLNSICPRLSTNCCSANAPYSISVLNKKRGIINLKIWSWTPHLMWTQRVNNTPDCKPCWPIECSINVTSLVTIFLFQSRTWIAVRKSLSDWLGAILPLPSQKIFSRAAFRPRQMGCWHVHGRR